MACALGCVLVGLDDRGGLVEKRAGVPMLLITKAERWATASC